MADNHKTDLTSDGFYVLYTEVKTKIKPATTLDRYVFTKKNNKKDFDRRRKRERRTKKFRKNPKKKKTRH